MSAAAQDPVVPAVGGVTSRVAVGTRAGLRLLAWAPAVLVPLVFLGFFFAWPAATLVARGFVGEDGALDTGAFHEVFTRARTWRIIGLTLGMAAAATTVSVLLGVPGAHVLYRCRFPGRSVARAAVAVPFVLPTVVVGVAFRSLLVPGGWLEDLHLDGTVWAVLAAMVFFNYSLVVRGVGSVWSRLDPRMVQAARALGATPTRAFLTVTLPALLPAIASAASVVFLFCATAFGIVLILGGVELATIESEIYLLTTAYLDLRGAAVLSVVQVLVIAAALWAAGQARRRSERALALRSDAVEHPLGAADAPAAALTALVVFGLLAAPLAQLLWRSFHRKGQFTLANWAGLADAHLSRAIRVSALEAAWNSMVVATQAAAIALIVGTLVALVVTRPTRTPRARRALAVLDSVFMLPLGVSAVTVGFGFLITLNAPPLDMRGSALLVPVAQAVVAVPLVVRMVAPVLRAIDPRQREAAATLGAGPLRVIATIDGAHLVRAGAVAIGFAFATSLGEFGATSFLSRPDAPTLPVMIYRLVSRPDAAEQGVAVAASVLLALIAATLMVLVEKGRPSTAGEFQ
ncbi:iron ABC transporter permease [Schaalia sp. 19OD2882]|uniref:ABC transporter permease n=1 Tax=Schaalia sp. 19OD2882 TaxID=2794089 RepID=UPI001C1EEB1D|nr:iron ABC transporter permease [Schaalia sp. 19OD2882]QWW19509.1 iron ABC transporter permease [Schaalia sp. 19OD2882]